MALTYRLIKRYNLPRPFTQAALQELEAALGKLESLMKAVVQPHMPSQLRTIKFHKQCHLPEDITALGHPNEFSSADFENDHTNIKRRHRNSSKKRSNDQITTEIVKRQHQRSTGRAAAASPRRQWQQRQAEAGQCHCLDAGLRGRHPPAAEQAAQAVIARNGSQQCSAPAADYSSRQSAGQCAAAALQPAAGRPAPAPARAPARPAARRGGGEGSCSHRPPPAGR
jgi:hypothetical protein